MSVAGTARALTLCTFGLLAACADGSLVFIALPESESRIGFLLAFDDLDAAPVSASTAFNLREPRPAELSATEDQQILLVVVDAERMAFTGVRPRSDPITEYKLELNAEPCPHGRLSREGDAARLRIALANAAHAYVASVDAPNFVPTELSQIGGLAAAALRLPVEPGGCRPIPLDALQPFDPDRVELIDENMTVRGVPARMGDRLQPGLVTYYMTAAGSDRIAATSRDEVLLFERGRPFSDDEAHRLSPNEVSGLPVAPAGEVLLPSWQNLDFLPGPNAGEGTLFTGLLLERLLEEDPEVRRGFYTALIAIDVSEHGFSSVRTATVWAGEIVEILAEPDGSVLALWNEPNPERGSNRDAYVLRGDSARGPWKSSVISSNIGGRSMRRTDDPRAPHLLGFSLGRAMLGNLALDPPELVELASDLTGDVDGIASAQTEAGSAVFVGTDRGNLSRISVANRTTTPLLFRMPLEASSCAPNLDGCGWAAGADRVLSLEYFSEANALAATFQGCEALIVLREDDLCPSAIPMLGRTEIGNSRSTRRLRRTEAGAIVFDVRGMVGELRAR